MRRLIAGAAIALAFPTGLWASFEDDPIAPELAPQKTSFAYRARHGAGQLPAHALTALWFSGEDRELPQDAVADPIVEVPPQVSRALPSRTALCHHAVSIAAEHDLPAPFFANLIQQESGFKSHAISPAGAQGIAQFMPRVARAYGLENPFDPLHSLAVSAKFLRELLGQFGNLGLAAAAYNAGPRRVQDWMARRGKLPEETRNYVRSITGHPAERWARVNAPTQGTQLPAHARCPGIPAIEVAVPEAAPVKVAKRIRGKAADRQKAVASTAAKKPEAVRSVGPKLAAAGTKSVVIKDGKITIVAPDKSKKPAAAKTVLAAKLAKPAKSAGKIAARPASKQSGKRIKVASAR